MKQWMILLCMILFFSACSGRATASIPLEPTEPPVEHEALVPATDVEEISEAEKSQEEETESVPATQITQQEEPSVDIPEPIETLPQQTATARPLPPDEPPGTPFDSFVDHPVHGLIGTTRAGDVYLWTYLFRDFNAIRKLSGDNQYWDIYGGMFFHAQTIYIFSLDDDAIREIVDQELTDANIQYELIPTSFSKTDLIRLGDYLNDNRNRYDVVNVFHKIFFNYISVEVRDLNNVSFELQRLVDQTKSIVLLQHMPAN